MCVLVVSYKPEKDEVCMSCVVGVYSGDMRIEFCQSGEAAINHVAYLNGWNEPGAADYEHWFIYPDNECPYETKDVITGQTVYKKYCIPMSQVSLDIGCDDDGIPEHFQEPIRVKTEEYRKEAQAIRQREKEIRDKRQEREHLESLRTQYESLKRRFEE